MRDNSCEATRLPAVTVPTAILSMEFLATRALRFNKASTTLKFRLLFKLRINIDIARPKLEIHYTCTMYNVHCTINRLASL